MKKEKLLLLLLAIVQVKNLAFSEDIKLGATFINPDYIEIEKLKSTKNVIVIDKNQIDEKGYTSVSQVLNDVPGITVGTTQWGEIDIRGQGDQASRNIQVMIDGVPITTLVSHPYGTNYDVVPVEQIEKIEVIPGGGSVLYGNGTVGGVINITTNLKAMSKPINKVGYEYSQDKEKKYYVNAGTKINDDLTVQLNYSKSDKDWYFVDTYNNSQYFSGGFNYRISDRQSFSFKYSHLEEEGQFIKAITKSNLEKYGKDYRPKYQNVTVGVDKNGLKIVEKKRSYLSSDREDDSFKLSYNYAVNESITASVDAFKSDGYFTNNDDDDTKMYQETIGTKAKLNIEYGEKSSILFGIDYFKQNASLHYSDYKMRKISNGDKVMPGQTVDGNYIKYDGKYTYKEVPLKFDYERFVKAIYFMNIYERGKFEFTQGMRYDITDWSFDKKASDGPGNDTSVRKNQNYELSIGYNYRDTGKVYARYERGFTGPDGQQISDRVLDSEGNKIYVKTEAEDEIFDIYEIGWRDYIWGSAFNLTLFYNTTDNQMNRVYVNGISESRTVNYLATDRYGIEFSANQSLGKFSFEESYSYLKGKSKYNDKGNQAIEDGNKIDWSNSGLQKVPKHMLTLKVDYEMTDNLSTGIAWKYTGKYNNFYNEADKDEDSLVKSNTVVDLSLKYNHPNGLSIYGGINNIFNEKYYSYSTPGSYAVVIPADSRTFYTGISYTF